MTSGDVDEVLRMIIMLSVMFTTMIKRCIILIRIDFIILTIFRIIMMMNYFMIMMITIMEIRIAIRHPINLLLFCVINDAEINLVFA